jgi:hypothetical protein
MASLTLRISKGSPLTFEEADGNFSALDEAKAELDSPAFVGTPSAPTPEEESDNDRIATTAFVKAQGFARLPITDEDVADDASISGRKISPDFGDQDLTTAGLASALSFVTSSENGGLRAPARAGLTFLSGSDDVDRGGNILCYGEEHPSLAGEVRLRQGAEIRLRVNAAGAITLLAGGLDQNISLIPSGSGTTNSPTFRATSTAAGGFQGVGSDSAAMPSFTFANDLSTGMFRVAAGVLGFSVDGQEALRLDADGVTRQAFFPAAAVIGTSAGSLRLSPAGTLLLEPAAGSTVRSTAIYGTQTAQPANMFVAENGNLQRSTYSAKDEIDSLKARVSALESQ